MVRFLSWPILVALPLSPFTQGHPTNSTYANSTYADWPLSELCKMRLERGTPNVEDQTVVADWVAIKLEEFNARKERGEPVQQEQAFHRWLVQRYMPTQSHTYSYCDYQHSCGPVDCSSIRSDIPIKEQYNAFLALENIGNMIQAMHTRKATSESANQWILNNKEEMINVFTDHENHAKHKAELAHKQMLGRSIGVALMLMLTAVVTAGASLALSAATAGVLSGTAAVFEKGLDSAAKASEDFARDVSKLFIQFSNAANSGANGIATVELGLHSGEPDKILDDIKRILDKDLSNLFWHSQSTSTKIMDDLLNGDRVANQTIADYVRTGEYAEPQVRTLGLEQFYKNAWVAAYLGIVWQRERTYIVESLATGSCKQDNRGPQHLKACLETHPDMVYHIYFIPRVREGERHQALIRGPPNHLKLGEFGNITLTDVVRASVAHRDTMENKTLNKDDAIESFLGHLHTGGRFHGLFRIPICRNPYGEAISSVMSENSRNYPCMCGDFDWRTGPSESGDNDETNKFLVDTGLWASGDWPRRCHNHQKCKRGHRRWKFPGKTKHHLSKAYTKCKHGEHRYQGWEKDGDNGWDSRDSPPPPEESQSPNPAKRPFDNDPGDY